MKTPQLLMERLPADFHRRLENWGEVMRDRSRRGVSPTYEICRAMAKRAGQGAWEGEAVEREWDEHDAAFIETAWRTSAGYRTEPRGTGVLRAYYVLGQPPAIICRFHGVRAREFDDVLVRGVMDFHRWVAILESRAHNQRHSVMTTV